ncbi:MAG: delta-lactam-biosynthetic de-N-acetylase [Ruminococcaceae bacterium]|nr:delta-lactam-biosynthetic de-N-acetylase [Oscillospiraceae bacterium]
MKVVSMIATILTALTVSVAGQAYEANRIAVSKGTDALSWYCKKNDSHDPPALPSEFSFISEYDGYYLDNKANEDNRVIYLTFDAGYENGNIERILDVLKEHEATGAFFVLGNLVRRNTDLVRRMLDEGHLVCNHTEHHHDMSRVKDENAFRDELNALASTLKECCGVEPAPFYRPPEGRFTKDNLAFAKKCGYKTIFWSFAYADWDNDRQMSPDKALAKVLAHTHNGEVLLLHPTSSTNAAILDELLTAWESEGYRFGTLYELTENG